MKLTPERFGQNRYGYAFEQVKTFGTRKHLDIGCFDGKWVAEVGAALGIPVHGVDVNGDAIDAGRKAGLKAALRHIQTISYLPFSNGEFDSITLLDVYEHLNVTQQAEVLIESLRLLRPGGILVITVPGRHLLSCLDIGNLKFRFPRLHRLYIQAKHGNDFYNFRYVNNPYGLVGDVSSDKKWHEHFRAQELSDALRAAGFEIVDVDGAGYFMRIFYVLYLFPSKIIRRFATWLLRVDYRWFMTANLFITARNPRSERELGVEIVRAGEQIPVQA
jgi:SAM-dependent methyltransferase